MNGKFLIYTALISLATIIGYEKYRAKAAK